MKIIPLLCGFLFLASSALRASERELPEPLSFSSAIEYIHQSNHYNYQLSDSKISSAVAKNESIAAKNDLDIRLKGHLRQVGVSSVGNSADNMDSKISLIAKKNIYDFGLTAAQEKVTTSSLQIERLARKLLEEKQELDVVKAYFNVLNADNDFLKNNENMSIAFIRFNRAEEKAEFGLSSDITILEAQSNYEKVRQQRYLSEANQRFSRQLLAEALGSSSLPDKLEIPQIDGSRKIVDNLEMLLDLALQNSLEIQLQKAKISLAQHSITLSNQTNNPSLEAELEISEYQKESAFRDDWRVSINFNIPLYSGDRNKSTEAIANAQLLNALASLKKLESTTRIKLLSLWQKINQKTVELDGAIIKQDYRDLYLERSRADYELEYKSDLGDAMVQFSKSRAEKYAIEFELELAWRELYQLIGESNKLQVLQLSERPEMQVSQ